MKAELPPISSALDSDGRSRLPKKNAPWSAYSHLLIARMRELQREPEIVFWVFVFPLLLALGLGIAFRNKPADVSSVAIVAGRSAQHTLEALQGGSSKFRVDILESHDALNRFRLGKYDLVIIADEQGLRIGMIPLDRRVSSPDHK